MFELNGTDEGVLPAPVSSLSYKSNLFPYERLCNWISFVV